MRLSQYLRLPETKTISELSDETGISEITLRNIARGMLLEKYKMAKRLSLATRPKSGGDPMVTIPDICDNEV